MSSSWLHLLSRKGVDYSRRAVGVAFRLTSEWTQANTTGDSVNDQGNPWTTDVRPEGALPRLRWPNDKETSGRHKYGGYALRQCARRAEQGSAVGSTCPDDSGRRAREQQQRAVRSIILRRAPDLDHLLADSSGGPARWAIEHATDASTRRDCAGRRCGGRLQHLRRARVSHRKHRTYGSRGGGSTLRGGPRRASAGTSRARHRRSGQYRPA